MRLLMEARMRHKRSLEVINEIPIDIEAAFTSMEPNPLIETISPATAATTEAVVSPIEVATAPAAEVQEPTQQAQITVDSYEIKFTRQTTKIDFIDQMKLYYETELKKWQDYGQQVQTWVQDVYKAIEQGNQHLLGAQNLAHENELLKKELRMREEEIQNLKKPHEPLITEKKPTFSLQDLI